MALGMDHLREAAGEVAMALARAKGRRAPMEEVGRYEEGLAWKRARETAEALRPCPGGAWTPATAAALAGNKKLPVKVDARTEGILRSTNALVLKAVRLAHALVNEDPSGIGTAEIRWMADALSGTFLVGAAQGMLDGRVDAGHPEPGDAVPFAFPFRHVRPRSRVTQAIHLGHGMALLERLSAGDAPVVARLSSPLGPDLEVRAFEGTVFRPVLAPGRWEPVTPSEFAAAAAAGIAWVDSPFGPPVGDSEVILAPADYAGPLPAQPDAAVAGAEAATVALARAGRLAVIDGVVHRSTQPPVLRVDVRDRWTPNDRGGHLGEEFELSLSWEFPDGLGMHVEQGTLARPWTAGRDYLENISSAARLPATLGDALDLALADLVAHPDPDQDGTRTHVPGNPVAVLDPAPFDEPWAMIDAAVAKLRDETRADGAMAPMQPLDKPGLLARLATLRERIAEPVDPDMVRFVP